MSPCSDGMGRTGAFICLHAQIERLKTEGVIDCFQFIKSARLNRPGLVQSVVSLSENASSNRACMCLARKNLLRAHIVVRNDCQ